MPAWINVSEIEIVYKSKVKASERPQIKNSRDAYDVFLSIWNLNQIDLIEEFKVMLLNRANRVLGILAMSVGGLVGTVADPPLNIWSCGGRCCRFNLPGT